jgi:2-haloacid dehalogenase
MSRTPVGAVVFDLFGTLLDISSLGEITASLLDKGPLEAAELVRRWRDKQIAYSFASSLMGRYRDFDDLTSRALDYALASAHLQPATAVRKKLCDAWLELRAYPDATLVLEALRSRGVRTAVLTNGTLATAKRALANSTLDTLLCDVWSVDEVRRYKPAPEVYALAVSRLDLRPAQIAFISSNGWDATGAAAFGFTVVWCNRHSAPSETLAPPPTHVVTSLESVPDLLEMQG